MSDRQPGKIIYIGSIPYDQTEEQVLDIAKSVGPVVNLKMMFDKETGRSKGYAFVEYPDVETAASAVRNLNDYSIGNRQLRCDFSWENNMSSAGTVQPKGRNEESLPPLPTGRFLEPGEAYNTAITNALAQLDDTRRQQIITDSVKMAKRNPVLLEELLAQCPQLTYAIVETLMITGKADSNQIKEILLPSAANGPQDDTAAAQVPEPQSVISAEDIAMIKQVIGLSDEVVAGLGDVERQQVMAIKENYRSGVYGAI